MSYITIKLRRGTAAQWTASNPVLAEGEAGLETDTRKFKVGDGLTAWSSLSYWQTGGGGGASVFTDLSDVPSTYVGQGGKLVRVKADASGLEFFTYTIAAGDLPTGIDAAKIADGTVSNAEFQYLNGVTSAIQTQLNGKQPLATVLTNTTASFTTALESKLNGIEAGADVTDATNVNAAGAVMNTDYSQAHSILVQQSGTGSPTVLPVPSQSIVGNNGGGDIVALTATQVRTLINVEDGADVTDAANVGAVNHAATAKTTPVDADTLPITDTQASNVIKKLSFTNLKAFLKTYFDGLYQAAGSYLTSANITANITNGVTDKAPSEDAVFDALALKQDVNADLTDLITKWTPASGSGGSSLEFAEDTDNGTNKVTIKAPDTLAADYTLTLPVDDGTSGQFLKTDGNGILSWDTAAGGSLTNWTEAYSSATQSTSSFAATNAASNVNAALVAKGTGALVAQVPTGTTVGGNSRGQYAVDWQMARNNANQVASGNYSVLAGGVNNRVTGNNGGVVAGASNLASGGSSFVGAGSLNIASGSNSYIGNGQENTASGNDSMIGSGIANTVSGTATHIPGGSRGVASLYGQFAHGSGRFSINGDAQRHTLIWRNSATGTSQFELFLDGSSARAIMTDNSIWQGIINISAVNSVVGNGTGTLGDVAASTYKVTIKRIANSTALVGTVQEIGTTNADTSMSSSVFTIDADDTNEALKIRFTPPSTSGSTSVYRVVAVFDGNQLMY